jgi:NAD(P)-dependent dehydrogenase (short-subunit alcohol dehydrogenase family)
MAKLARPRKILTGRVRVNSLACRNPGLAEEAIDKIRAIVPGSDLRFLKLDITSLNSAHSAAQEFLQSEERLDILVNNAGIVCFSSEAIRPPSDSRRTRALHLSH